MTVAQQKRESVGRLPDLPSELLLVALTDLEWIETHPESGYRVDMGQWHTAGVDGYSGCRVCFAGAVMARRLDAPMHTSYPGEFDDDTARKLSALDLFRKGAISVGLYRLGLDDTALATTYATYAAEFPDYHIDRDGWWTQMLGLVGILQAEGL